jgi:exopolysaccharide biosynthesis polyprenyl glycosylphosphotransferase
MLACSDVVAACAASLSLGVAGGSDVAALSWSLAYIPVWVVVAKVLGLYDRDQRSLRHLTVDEVSALFVWSVCSTLGLALFLQLTPAEPLDLSSGVRVALIAAVASFGLRSGTRWLWRIVTPPERVAIVGGGQLAAAAERKLALFPDVHVEVVERVSVEALRDLDADPGWLAAIDRVIVASAAVSEDRIRQLVALGRAYGVKLSVVPPVYGMFGTAVQLNHIAELPVIEYNTWDASRSTLMLKRIIDVVGSAVALVVLSPILALIAVVVKLDSRGPVIFTQLRAGMEGQPFRIFKFRTMVADAEQRLPDIVPLHELREPVFKLVDDPRLTRSGRFLRRWSLDELPQLANVLAGHMSLVGPRPEELRFVERYTPEQRLRLGLRPGMTGPMQVNGRGALTLEERLAVEREYLENLSIGRDARILVMTLSAVIQGKGAY